MVLSRLRPLFCLVTINDLTRVFTYDFPMIAHTLVIIFILRIKLPWKTDWP